MAVVERGYLVSVDARPRILVDPGSGTLERLERSRFELALLEQILLTRLEVDRSGDLPALVAYLYAQGRARPIALTGPAGMPGADEFVRLLFGPDGAWRYLAAFNGFGLTVREAPSALSDLAVYSIPVEPFLEELDVSLYAVAVPDGPLPAAAFRIDCGEESIVLAGGLSRPTPSFYALAAECGTLVSDGTLEAGTIDEIATTCRAKALLVLDKRMIAGVRLISGLEQSL